MLGSDVLTTGVHIRDCLSFFKFEIEERIFAHSKMIYESPGLAERLYGMQVCLLLAQLTLVFTLQMHPHSFVSSQPMIARTRLPRHCTFFLLPFDYNHFFAMQSLFHSQVMC